MSGYDDMLDRAMHDHFDPCGAEDHQWLDDDAWFPVDFEDQSCLRCGMFRIDVNRNVKK